MSSSERGWPVGQRRSAATCCTRPAPATDLRFHTQGTISRKEHIRALSDRRATSGTHACPTHNSGQSLACFCHLVHLRKKICNLKVPVTQHAWSTWLVSVGTLTLLWPHVHVHMSFFFPPTKRALRALTPNGMPHTYTSPQHDSLFHLRHQQTNLRHTTRLQPPRARPRHNLNDCSHSWTHSLDHHLEPVPRL